MEWQYYNHALLPVCAPHKVADITDLKSGALWKKYPNAVFASWTSDFDCKEDTGWWVVIKDDDSYSIEGLNYKQRKNVRKAERNCYVKIIDSTEYAEELAEVYYNAAKKYQNCTLIERQELIEGFCNPNGRVYWGGFDRSNDKLIGYMTIIEHKDYVEIPAAKFATDYLKLMVSDAIYSAFLDYYLNEKGVKYISTGFRSIQHNTNTQDYEIKHFSFRKVNVKLHVEINPRFKFIVNLLFLFRGVLRFGVFDKIGIIHKINGVLFMKEISDGNSRL